MSKRGDQAEDGWVSREVEALVSAWERGERATVQEVLDRRPDLDAEAAIRLIYEETCLRREAGQELGTDEVVGRYPRWGVELRALLECDRLIRSPHAIAEFPEVGEALGTFLLLAELGRGASGRTYLASDPTLADRPVVVKVIPDDQDEHLALARLRHTHIVPLFSEHTFPDRGLRGLCMPFLGGASLAQILDDLAEVPLGQRSGKLLVKIIDQHTRATPSALPADSPFRRSLEQASYVQAMTWIVACLADALHYAHGRGLVHMDIKPSNVLITVDGQPMLLDFHLARGPMLAGEWIGDRLGGTPGWMSPEQESAMAAVGEGRPVPFAVDGRSDIFALGLLLDEALGGSGRHGPIEPNAVPRADAMSIGMADIIQKCVASDPDSRYHDAATLAEDLRRELNDLPLRGVRNRSIAERWRKWRRRHPGILAWGVTGLVVVLAAGVAIAASVNAYSQRVGQLKALLEDGKRYRANGRYAEAIRTLERGLNTAGNYPALGTLNQAMQHELRLSERARLADELHTLADRVRFRYGIELPSHADEHALLRLCRTIWERRDLLLRADGPSLDLDPEQKIRTDMLELAAIRADLGVRLAPADRIAEARRDALQLLDEAEASCGPSFAIDARREQFGGVPRRAGEGEKSRVPKSAWEHYELGRYHLRNDRIATAADEFRRTLELRPQDFWPNFYYGLCGFRLRRFDDSAAAFQVCIALSPESAICHYNRALAYDALGRAEDAKRGYSRAIELDPDLAPGWLNRGILSYKSGRHGNAVSDFEQGIKARPDRETSGRLYFNLALAQLANRDRSSALANARKAVDLGCMEAIRLRDELR
ncbi:MAG: rqkA [Planctomycetota bacterium]|nr:rqkA [Planctomycetota bacterium]